MSDLLKDAMAIGAQDAPTFEIRRHKAVGKLYILPDVCIESKGPKPDQKHLDAMRDQFGWKWEDL